MDEAQRRRALRALMHILLEDLHRRSHDPTGMSGPSGTVDEEAAELEEGS